MVSKSLEMEILLKKELGSLSVKSYGRGASGSISSGVAYITDNNGHVFAKSNPKEGARVMFNGEFESLNEIAATNTVRVPKPLKVFDDPKGGAVLAMEYLDINSLHTQSAELGEQIARLHLCNTANKNSLEKTSSSVHKDYHVKYIDKFGFHETTCCGYIPQDNSWNADWVDFFVRQKLNLQIDKVFNDYHDREILEYWPMLQRKIPEYFKNINITPALLHGDLWGGNVGETETGPVVFDPASFYGHSEYELGISCMFGGFKNSFFDSYFKLIPKQPGYSKRLDLYKLFNYLNHWNHFGTGYRGQSISLMKALS